MKAKNPEDCSNNYDITGFSAELRWGYHRAATLGAWTVSNANGAFILTADIVTMDRFKVTQKPLTVRTPNGWVWNVREMGIQNKTLMAHITSARADAEAYAAAH